MHLCKYIEQRYHCKDNDLPKCFLHSFKCGGFTCSLQHFSHVLTFEEFSLKTDLVPIREPDIKLVVIRNSSKQQMHYLLYVFIMY